MRKFVSVSVLLAVLLSVPPICRTQTVDDCDSLRSKAEQLEKMEAEMPPSLQKLNKEARLKIYLQLGQCERRQISVVSQMANTVAGTDAAGAVEDKLRSLVKQNSDTEKKLSDLRIALNLPDPG